MGEPFTDNNGTTYYNINQCKSFTITIAASGFSRFRDMPCSEVVILNSSGASISAVDSNSFGSTNALVIPYGTGTFSYRTQFFSNNPQR
jgi:hypothetical protein